MFLAQITNCPATRVFGGIALTVAALALAYIAAV